MHLPSRFIWFLIQIIMFHIKEISEKSLKMHFGHFFVFFLYAQWNNIELLGRERDKILEKKRTNFSEDARERERERMGEEKEVKTDIAILQRWFALMNMQTQFFPRGEREREKRKLRYISFFSFSLSPV